VRPERWLLEREGDVGRSVQPEADRTYAGAWHANAHAVGRAVRLRRRRARPGAVAADEPEGRRPRRAFAGAVTARTLQPRKPTYSLDTLDRLGLGEEVDVVVVDLTPFG